eukprot:3097885-Prymnesium_polylepis.1
MAWLDCLPAVGGADALISCHWLVYGLACYDRRRFLHTWTPSGRRPRGLPGTQGSRPGQSGTSAF